MCKAVDSAPEERPAGAGDQLEGDGVLGLLQDLQHVVRGVALHVHSVNLDHLPQIKLCVMRAATCDQEKGEHCSDRSLMAQHWSHLVPHTDEAGPVRRAPVHHTGHHNADSAVQAGQYRAIRIRPELSSALIVAPTIGSALLAPPSASSTLSTV